MVAWDSEEGSEGLREALKERYEGVFDYVFIGSTPFSPGPLLSTISPLCKPHNTVIVSESLDQLKLAHYTGFRSLWLNSPPNDLSLVDQVTPDFSTISMSTITSLVSYSLKVDTAYIEL